MVTDSIDPEQVAHGGSIHYTCLLPPPCSWSSFSPVCSFNVGPAVPQLRRLDPLAVNHTSSWDGARDFSTAKVCYFISILTYSRNRHKHRFQWVVLELELVWRFCETLLVSYVSSPYSNEKLQSQHFKKSTCGAVNKISDIASPVGLNVRTL